MSRSLYIAALMAALCAPVVLRAQEDQPPSLGEVAREARKAKTLDTPASTGQRVIDNDNFSAVLDEAEAARLTGKPVFSIDPSGSAFRMTSPDGTCSLSFDAKATALISSSFVSSDLPQDELPKLEGHALIHDDIVEISVHNGTPWELRELVIGITVLRFQSAVQLDASAAEPKMVSDPSWTGKRPDSTVIYHLRGSVSPNSNGTLSAILGSDSNISISGNADWHWALVSARGIPPASQGSPHDVTSSALSNPVSQPGSMTQPDASTPSADVVSSPQER
jgi:hypothetical protein